MANLYLLTRPDKISYDEYIECIVCANSEEARNIHPSGDNKDFNHRWNTWVQPKDVIVELIGTAIETLVIGVVSSSFNAG